ncbi:MAG TPA: undecaprenyl-diphosphate phosphatase [Candidatus Woesebacteria bacterium]|nr:undecaprenyl-diphosphate phosphatase [Candidatus Woesebacteria bacterium]
MSLFQSIILSFVQGVTEFLPISSDGHLNLFQHFFKLTPSLTFDVFLHAATFLSVVFFFRNQIKYFFSNLKYIIVGSIPAVIVGFFFKDQIESLFSNPKLLPLFFLATAIPVFSTKFIKKQDKKITYFSAFIIGLFQSIAILPGVSRSGLTIFSALLLGLSSINAFNFSFCLFLPASFGAIVLSTKDIISQSIITPNNLIAFVVAFFTGLIALKFLKKVVTGQKFWIFGIYTFILALTLTCFSI